jgi:single-strand DNA-binding protein
VNETLVTVAGNVAAEPRERFTASGSRVASFRLAATERRFDKAIGEWRDGDTVFYTVTCWRGMAENVAQSVQKGQPMIVHGRLRVSTYEDKEGVTRTTIEVEARALGHDLTWGVSSFTKQSSGAASPERQAVASLARELDEQPSYGTHAGDGPDDPVEPDEQDAA